MDGLNHLQFRIPMSSVQVLISVIVFSVSIESYLVGQVPPGYFPSQQNTEASLQQWVVELVLNYTHNGEFQLPPSVKLPYPYGEILARNKVPKIPDFLLKNKALLNQAVAGYLVNVRRQYPGLLSQPPPEYVWRRYPPLPVSPEWRLSTTSLFFPTTIQSNPFTVIMQSPTLAPTVTQSSTAAVTKLKMFSQTTIPLSKESVTKSNTTPKLLNNTPKNPGLESSSHQPNLSAFSSTTTSRSTTNKPFPISDILTRAHSRITTNESRDLDHSKLSYDLQLVPRMDATNAAKPTDQEMKALERDYFGHSEVHPPVYSNRNPDYGFKFIKSFIDQPPKITIMLENFTKTSETSRAVYTTPQLFSTRSTTSQSSSSVSVTSRSTPVPAAILATESNPTQTNIPYNSTSILQQSETRSNSLIPDVSFPPMQEKISTIAPQPEFVQITVVPSIQQDVSSGELRSYLPPYFHLYQRPPFAFMGDHNSADSRSGLAPPEVRQPVAKIVNLFAHPQPVLRTQTTTTFNPFYILTTKPYTTFQTISTPLRNITLILEQLIKHKEEVSPQSETARPRLDQTNGLSSHRLRFNLPPFYPYFRYPFPQVVIPSPPLQRT